MGPASPRRSIGTSARLGFEALEVGHAEELASLLDPRVNAHFNDAPADLPALHAQFRRMTSGPGDRHPGQTWLNVAVRRLATGDCIGRLQATVQGDHAEVAFVFAAEAWGRGYAREATEWLQDRCERAHGVRRFWATVLPANARSLALCRRLGYEVAPPGTWPALASHDPGDAVLTRAAGPLAGTAASR